MPRDPALTDADLQALRAAMAQARDHRGGVMPKAEVARLVGEMDTAHPVTIDFDAEPALGQPLVVVQVPPEPDQRFEVLSRREREVAALLAQGLRNKDIGQRLFISVATVKDHVHQILKKTGLSSRTEVAAAWRGE